MIKVIGHRGYSEKYKENTITAFTEAFKAGADYVKTDVQLTSCGKVILHHGYVVKGMSIPIIKATYEEILLFDRDIPLLENLLSLLAKEFPDKGVYLELKDRAVVNKTLEIVKKYDAFGRVVFGSFDLCVIEEVKRIEPEAKVSLLLGTVFPFEDVLPLAVKKKIDFLHPCWEQRAYKPQSLLTERDVLLCKERGIDIVLWHEERVEVLKDIIQLPVWGICTNDVSLLVKILE